LPEALEFVGPPPIVMFHFIVLFINSKLSLKTLERKMKIESFLFYFLKVWKVALF